MLFCHPKPRLRIRKAFGSAVAFLLLVTLSQATALAVVKPQKKSERLANLAAPDYFPVTAHVAKQVWFWEAVFSKYGANHMLLHDADFPDVIVDIIDFNQLAKQSKTKVRFDRRNKDAVTQRYIDRYHLAVKRFKEIGTAATKYGPMEQRIYSVYKKNPNATRALMAGKITIRGQAGMMDEFRRAARRAEQHLPYMEDIFRQVNAPRDLTRLAFVESMFNTDAVSKVGASGIWQFMPQTARTYMLVNHYIDERNSPFKASKAAARLLLHNYRELKSWPLAITAYNHGRGGMAKATRKIGSKDLSQIILRYRAPSFGFASKNFYAEFVAAKNIYNKFYAPKKQINAKLVAKPMPINKRISISHLVRFTPLDLETIKQYNPCLLPQAFSSYKYQPLPLNYELMVPKHIAKEVKLAIDKIKVPEYSARSTW